MANYPLYGYNPYGYMPQQFSAPRAEYPPQPLQRSMQAAQPSGDINNSSGFICRPVTSRAAAEVAQIPFDGSTHLFYDTSADCIYSKTFNMNDGTAPITTYVREVPVPPVRYATLEDLNALREELTKPKKAGKKNESDSDE